MNINQKLSTNFTLYELIKSQTVLRLGIENTPSDEVLQNMTVLCARILEPIREEFAIPFTPNSCFRSEKLNTAIGGSDRSQHMLGQAADIEVPGVSNQDLALWISQNITYDQLILECYSHGAPHSGWVHVSYRNTSNKLKLMTFDGKTYVPCLIY